MKMPAELDCLVGIFRLFADFTNITNIYEILKIS